MRLWLTSASADFRNAQLIQNTQISRAFRPFSLPPALRQPFSAFQAPLSCVGQQMSAGHPQIRQGKQRYHLRRILGQSSEAHLRIAKLLFDYAERVFDLGTDLGLGLLDLAQCFVQGTALPCFL